MHKLSYYYYFSDGGEKSAYTFKKNSDPRLKSLQCEGHPRIIRHTSGHSSS